MIYWTTWFLLGIAFCISAACLIMPEFYRAARAPFSSKPRLVLFSILFSLLSFVVALVLVFACATYFTLLPASFPLGRAPAPELYWYFFLALIGALLPLPLLLRASVQKKAERKRRGVESRAVLRGVMVTMIAACVLITALILSIAAEYVLIKLFRYEAAKKAIFALVALESVGALVLFFLLFRKKKIPLAIRCALPCAFLAFFAGLCPVLTLLSPAMIETIYFYVGGTLMTALPLGMLTVYFFHPKPTNREKEYFLAPDSVETLFTNGNEPYER